MDFESNFKTYKTFVSCLYMLTRDDNRLSSDSMS